MKDNLFPRNFHERPKMPPILRDTLIRIEEYKQLIPHYKELLDVLEEIIILREQFRKRMNQGVFAVEESLIDVKLGGGLPLIGFSQDLKDSSQPEEYFQALLALTEMLGDEESAGVRRFLAEESVSYAELIRSTFSVGCVPNRFESVGEDDEIAFDILRFFVEESLRPALEVIVERYGPRIRKKKWDEGYCPVCGREPKIGKLMNEGNKRVLFCNQCGYEWRFKKEKCPFCGNEDKDELAYFIVEDEERYRVDVCNYCKRYVKSVDVSVAGEGINMDVEDIATLHLDILANEEGYD